MVARVLIWLFGVMLFVDFVRETVQPLAIAP